MAIVYVLHDIVGFSRKRCPMSYLTDSLNDIVGPRAISKSTEFTEAIIKNAFCHDNNDTLVRCRDITDDDNLDGILHIRWGRRGSHRKSNLSDQEYVYDFCLFKDMECAKVGQNCADDARSMTNSMVQSPTADVVPKELRNALIDFLKLEAKEKAKAKAKKRAAMEKEMAKKVEKRRRQSVDTEDEEEKEKTVEDDNGKDVIQSLRAQVNELRIHRDKTQTELDRINLSLDIATANLTKAISLSSDGVVDGILYDYSCDTVNKSTGDRICLQYYYKGRSGVLHLVGDNQVLVEADFMKGLLPLVRKISTTEDPPATGIKSKHP